MAAPLLSRDGSPLVTDEVVNSSTHLAGAVFALLGMVLLVVRTSVAGKPWHIVGFAVYGMCLFLLFLASALHHGVPASGGIARLLRVLDYAAVFLLIAGSMTPVCLVLLRTPVGWSVFGVAWAVGCAGIALKATVPTLPKWVTNTLYVAMGWLALALVRPLALAVGWAGVAWLAAGGILYTAGAVIFALEKPNPVPGRFGFHEVWHVFVLAGAAAHYVFMYRYVMPAP